jgi:hypothetical protein
MVINWRVKNSLSLSTRDPNSSGIDSQSPADRNIDDKKILHCNSLRFFCHQSFCQPVCDRTHSPKSAPGAETLTVCNADQKENDFRQNDFLNAERFVHRAPEVAAGTVQTAAGLLKVVFF